MKTWKLVGGIISIVLSLFVMLQSCAAGIVGAMEQSQGVDGTAGIMVALFMIIGGIISIATRNSTSKGGNIAIIIIFGLAGLLGISNNEVYKDLMIWGIWCFINAGLAVKDMLNKKKLQY